MQQNLIKQFNLPNYVKGKSFGEAAKAIQAKFKGRNDSVSLNTQEELLGSLQQAQEYVKMQQGLENESQQVPDQMDGQVPEGMEEYAGGGFMDQSRDTFGNLEGGVAGGVMGAAGDVVGIGKDLFGNTGIDTTGTEHQESRNVGMDTAGKALKGAATGMKIGGPLGAAIGGVVSGAAGFIGAKRANKDIAEANNNFVQGQSADMRESRFAYGGAINKLKLGGDAGDTGEPELGFQAQQAADTATQIPRTTATARPLASTIQTTPLGQIDTNPADIVTRPPMAAKTTLGQKLGYAANEAGKWGKKNAGNVAQYSGILGNALALKNLKRGVTERGSRLDNTYTPQQFDEASLVNQVNQDNTVRALKEASTGDAGSLRSNLLAADIGKQKALSTGRQHADTVNREEMTKKHQFDLQRDKTNVMLDQNFIENKAKDEAAFQTTKSNLKQSLFKDAGSIGREEVDKKIVKEIFGYKYDGQYVKDPEGNVVNNDKGEPMTKEELEAKKKATGKVKKD